jgi:hypothetical protein
MKILKTNSSIYPPVLQRFASAGLARLWNHMFERPFAILSAHQGTDNLTEEGRVKNNTRQDDLKELLGQYQIGFIEMKGAWKNDAIQRYIPEDSLFIVGIDKTTTKQLAEKMGQQAFIWGNNGQFVVEDTQSGAAFLHGNVADNFHILTQDEIQLLEEKSKNENLPPGYSAIKGKKWVFDPDTKKRLKVLREQMDKPQEVDKMASSSTYGEMGFFYMLKESCKYMRTSGILDNKMVGDSPSKSLLNAYIPLVEVPIE